MKSKGNIVFLGMMGSGKTSIGKLFSQKHKFKFYDTDKFIENNLGMQISKIFTIKGEAFFRSFEEKITLDILKKKNIVIALGGGSFLNKKIQKEVLKNHTSFWLNWDKTTIINRIKSSAKRPVAYKATPYELNNLIKKRSNIYAKALYKVDCDGLSKLEIVKKVFNLYETN
tara:strand:- start:13205 stop:13717 length:513 start_codon:yes stop_codon:yes gene_type:complete